MSIELDIHLTSGPDGSLIYKGVSPRGYNPQQPRDPAGSPTGGRWSRVGDMGPALAKMMAGELRKRISDMEKYTIIGYTGGSSNQINEYLRKGSFTRTDGWDGSQEDLVAEIDIIDKVFEKADLLPKDVVVHRYVDKADMFPAEGSLFVDKAYVSTSFDEEGHAAVKQEFGSQAKISVQIRVPAGTPVIPMTNGIGLEAYYNQRELLLHRGLQFKVLKKAKLAVLLEVVNDD